MKKNIMVILILLYLASPLYSQQAGISIIKGTITDKETGEALEGASVYFAETTIGSMAAKRGEFYLEVRKPGNYELIVSMVGYSIQKKSMQVAKGVTYIEDFKLVQKPLNINTVEIQGIDQGEWRSNLRIFTRKFLGELRPSNDCVIENKEVINFKWAGDTLTAFTDKPVIIINNFLGYKVICEISDYRYVPLTTFQQYAFVSRFEELTPADESEKEKWERNREEVFYGSSVHFLWALKHNVLKEEKFIVHFTSSPAANSRDSFREVKSIMDLKYKDQFLDEPVLSFEGYLRVRYNNLQVSFVKARFPMFTIDSYGIADNHLPFISFGYWSYSGVANLLPRGYLPGRLKIMSEKNDL